MRIPCGCPPKRTFSAGDMRACRTERDRVKQREGYGTTPWSLRSVRAAYTDGFCLVNTDGSAGTNGAYNSWAVAPGFDL